MDDEIRRHLKGIRILVTIALLAACISFAFTYVLFKEVSIPLERLRSKEIASLESKVNALMATRLDGRMDVELQTTILNLKDLIDNSSGEIQAKALKAFNETQALLDSIRKARSAKKAQ